MIENIQPLFLSDNFKSSVYEVFKKKIIRHDVSGFRLYTDENKKSYLSLTTMLGATMPKQKQLEKWREKMIASFEGDIDAVDDFVEMTADYGTYLHIALSDFIRNGKVNWLQFEDDCQQWLISKGFKSEVLYSAAMELASDFASIVKFMLDYDVKPVAVEIPVSYGNIMTCNDVVVSMLPFPIPNEDMTKEERQEFVIGRGRIFAVGNLKSGKKGFFKTHKLQMAAERIMFNNTFSQFQQATHAFNFAPNNWRDKPTYKVKIYTPDELQTLEQEFFNYYKTAELNGLFDNRTKKIKNFSGETYAGENPTNNFKWVDVADYVFEKELNLIL